MNLDLIADERSKRAEITLNPDELYRVLKGISKMYADTGELPRKKLTWRLITKTAYGAEEIVFICPTSR